MSDGPAEPANHRVKRQLESLPLNERQKCSEILNDLLALDEQLADLHLCLPTVQIVFFLLDRAPTTSVKLRLEEMLAMLRETEGDAPSDANSPV